ncbi:hypothetical protein ACVW19_006631 [Streptomyces sp. TE5632]
MFRVSPKQRRGDVSAAFRAPRPRWPERGAGTWTGPPGSGGASGSGQAPGRTPLRATSEYQRALALGMRVPVG